MTASGDDPSTADASEEHWTRACRAAATEERSVSLRVHTRSAAPEYGTREHHDRVLSRVRELEESGHVADASFDVWGKHVGATGTERRDDPTDSTVETYRAWADRRGVTLPFEERECNSTLIEDSYTVVVAPHLLVGVVDGDGTVLGVAPCVDESGPTSVMDLLTLLGEPGRRDDRRASVSA